MIEIDDRFTNVRDIKDVAEEIGKRNECVDVYYKALAWLREATKNKLDKKATKAILTKHKTEYNEWHSEERDLGNGYGWRITMGDSRYNDRKTISIDVCKVVEHDGKPYLEAISGMDWGDFSYESGSTWGEVIEVIDNWAKPKKQIFNFQDAYEIHKKLTWILDELRKMEEDSNKHHKECGWYYTKFLKKY